DLTHPDELDRLARTPGRGAQHEIDRRLIAAQPRADQLRRPGPAGRPPAIVIGERWIVPAGLRVPEEQQVLDVAHRNRRFSPMSGSVGGTCLVGMHVTYLVLTG